MRYVRMLALGAAIGIVGLVVAGCGSDDKNSAKSASSDGKAVDVAYVTFAYTDYVQAEEKGIKSAVEPTGGSVKVFNANFDPQKLAQQCQDAIASGRYNAIALTPVDPASGKLCAANAKAAGIPVVAIESPVGDDPANIQPQAPGIVGVVATDITRGAETTAALTKDACADLDPCKVIVEIGFPGDPSGSLQLEKIKQLPNVKVVQTIAAQFNPAVITKAFPDALTAHPDLNVFVGAADSQALAVLPILNDAGKADQIKVIGNGGSRQGQEAVAAGKLFGTIGNWPQQGGALTGKMLVQAVNGDPVSPNSIDALSIDEPLVVEKDTAAQFKPEWGAAATQ